MSTIPLPALSINTQQPSPIDEYSKLAGLQSLLQNQQTQRQLAPAQVQEAQANAQSASYQAQMQQLALKNQQTAQSVLADPNFNKDFTDWRQSKTSQPTATDTGSAGQAPGATAAASGQSALAPQAGTIPGGPALGSGALHPLAQFLVEKKGLPLLGPGGGLELSSNLLASQQKYADLAKTQGEAGAQGLDNAAKQLKNFNDLAEPILAEKDPAKQAALIPTAIQEITANPTLYPAAATQKLQSLNTVQGWQTAANTSTVQQYLIDNATKSAEASQKVQAAAAPTPAQLKNATDTLRSYGALPPATRLGLMAEMNGAPDYETLQKIQARAETQQNANQLHQDTLANTKAIMGNKFGEAGLTANEKIWTDPQRGYAGALAQANQTKQSIVAGADGNALLTNMVPTMEVLGVNHAAGISRISPQEAIAAGTSPEWATRWNAFATKAATGKLTPELAKEGNQLMDIVTNAAYGRAVTSGQLIAKGHGLDPSQVPAMSKDGSITTLDKVSSQNGPQGGGLIYARDPQGKLHSAAAGTKLPPGWTGAQGPQ